MQAIDCIPNPIFNTLYFILFSLILKKKKTHLAERGTGLGQLVTINIKSNTLDKKEEVRRHMRRSKIELTSLWIQKPCHSLQAV